MISLLSEDTLKKEMVVFYLVQNGENRV